MERKSDLRSALEEARGQIATLTQQRDRLEEKLASKKIGQLELYLLILHGAQWDDQLTDVQHHAMAALFDDNGLLPEWQDLTDGGWDDWLVQSLAEVEVWAVKRRYLALVNEVLCNFDRFSDHYPLMLGLRIRHPDLCGWYPAGWNTLVLIGDEAAGPNQYDEVPAAVDDFVALAARVVASGDTLMAAVIRRCAGNEVTRLLGSSRWPVGLFGGIRHLGERWWNEEYHLKYAPDRQHASSGM